MNSSGRVYLFVIFKREVIDYTYFLCKCVRGFHLFNCILSFIVPSDWSSAIEFHVTLYCVSGSHETNLPSESLPFLCRTVKYYSVGTVRGVLFITVFLGGPSGFLLIQQYQ